jgi:hypothetical protein
MLGVYMYAWLLRRTPLLNTEPGFQTEPSPILVPAFIHGALILLLRYGTF